MREREGERVVNRTRDKESQKVQVRTKKGVEWVRKKNEHGRKWGFEGEKKKGHLKASIVRVRDPQPRPRHGHIIHLLALSVLLDDVERRGGGGVLLERGDGVADRATSGGGGGGEEDGGRGGVRRRCGKGRVGGGAQSCC